MTPRPLLFLRRFLRSEDGFSTVEFAIFVPFLFALFISCFEAGMLMTRNMVLDRGLDLAVRDIRLGLVTPMNEATVRARICEGITIIDDCENQLRLEMRPLDPRAWAMIPDTVNCVNRTDMSLAPREFNPGASNQLMILRACILLDPFFPTGGLVPVPQTPGGGYAVTSTASYVIEPG